MVLIKNLNWFEIAIFLGGVVGIFFGDSINEISNLRLASLGLIIFSYISYRLNIIEEANIENG